MIRILGIGGGSGLPVLLRGLKQLARAETEGRLPQGRPCLATGASRPAPPDEAGMDISALVCITDNGGSSGLLREELRIPAVGDLRNCLVALAGCDSPLVDVFQYRFRSAQGLDGHSLGNLIVAGLCQATGSLHQALAAAARLLDVGGRVLAASETPLVLCAEMEDGSVARGEQQIASAGRRIQHLWLEPDEFQVSQEALEAIARADTIVLGPGSVYTSILPNLLLPPVAAAIRNSSALKVYVCNLMTQAGETQGFTAADHLRVLESYLGRGVVDICLLNSRPVDRRQECEYWQTGACVVPCDAEEIAAMGAVPVSADLIDPNEPRVRHDPLKLARLVVSLTRGAFRARDILCGRGMIAV